MAATELGDASISLEGAEVQLYPVTTCVEQLQGCLLNCRLWKSASPGAAVVLLEGVMDDQQPWGSAFLWLPHAQTFELAAAS